MGSVEGKFEFDEWNEVASVDLASLKGAVTKGVKRYSAGIEGTSVVLMASGVAGSAQTYVATELFDLTFDGQHGQFLGRHRAAMGKGVRPCFEIEIIGGTGTGDLAGISGGVTITKHDDGTHSVSITYELA